MSTSPLGEHEAVPSAAERGCHVVDDLTGTGLVGGEVAVDGGHAAGCGRVGVTGVPEGRGVHAQDGLRHDGFERVGRQGAGCLLADGVADRAELHPDQVVELVTPIRGGGKTEPAPCGDLPHRVFERGDRNMVALVDDDQAVAGAEIGNVVCAGQALQGGDVDGAGGLGPSAAALAGLDAEQVVDAGPPLVGEGLAVDQHERRHAVGGDQCAGDDGLARAGWRDQHTEVMGSQYVVRGLLIGIEGRCEIECMRLSRAALVGEFQAAAGLLDQICETVEQAAGKDQVTGEGLVVAAQEPRHIPGGGPSSLAFVGVRVGHRRRVFEGGQ